MVVSGNNVTRGDGLAWADDGYAVNFANGQPQHVQVGGEASTRTVSGFGSTACPYSDPFPGCGVGSVLQLGGAALATPSGKTLVSIADPKSAVATASMNISVQGASGATLPTSTLLCGTCNFLTAGFKNGMQVLVSGLAGDFTIQNVTATTMTLANVALTPTLTGLNAPGGAPVLVTVRGWDPLRTGGIRIGGDTITVGGAGAGPVLAGPNSPLVVYGDTSQDGAWYAGHPYDTLGYEFGPKPFDPFTKIPDAENEDDEWVFPLANPYVYAGNDVIDAHALFADISCTIASCPLPSVGFTAYGGAGNDLIIGSQAGDHLAGGSGDDEIRGLRGADHIYGDSGANVNILTRAVTIDTENSSPGPTITTAGFINNGTTIEPYASPVADTMDAGRDLIYGDGPGTIGSPPTAPQSAYDDIVFGDHGAVIQQVSDPNLPDARLQKIQTTLLSSVRRIESRAYQNGNDDTVFGGYGRDVIVGGAGNDMLDGMEQDDLVFGDQVFLNRRVVETGQTDITAQGDITSGRFETLCGGLLYTRSDQPTNVCPGDPVPNADTSGKLLVDGVWRDFRDPDSGPGGIDAFPWWAEYAVNFSDGDPTHHFHDLTTDLGNAGASSFGNDYIAGGPGNDLLFGQLGNDTIQGDGGIQSAFARLVDDATVTSHVSASRTPDGCGLVAGTYVCDYVGDLDIVPSVEAPTDGEDYIEGNGGNDSVFGGLGQDDIVGGNSSFFSLGDRFVTISGLTGTWRIVGIAGNVITLEGATLPTLTATKTVSVIGATIGTAGSMTMIGTATGGTITFAGFDWTAGGFVVGRLLRPDGNDILFGGSGQHIGRDDDTNLGTADVNHARDADTIVGDNGDIVRIVGINHVDDLTLVSPRKYETFVYDNYGAMKLVVRGVTLLDYTPGGPDFNPVKFGISTQPACNGSPASGNCSTPISACYTGAGVANNGADRAGDIGGRDEIHGETGDDTAYAGCGNDVLYGDSQDDDLIGGWGDDWFSGGTGQDGAVGDDGRIFTSRNAGCSAASSSVCNELSEPLYGVYRFRTIDPDTKTSQGDVLNEFIYTPGMVQTATINVAGAYKKAVDLTPYNVTPSNALDDPLYDANNSDDVIFGGWDDDFLHGAVGDDAMSGAEALGQSYVQLYPANDTCQQGVNCAIGLIRTDWTRPYNPGDMLRFGADTNAWHSNHHNAGRLGEFLLYDEYDPLRAILFNADGSVWSCAGFSNNNKTCTNIGGPAPTSRQYFLNFDAADGRVTPPGCDSFAPNGTCLHTSTKFSDGNDAIFGDLGNDWLMGGTSTNDPALASLPKDSLWGGWGNDLVNIDDDLSTGCAVYDNNGKCATPGSTWLNDVPDTHPSYEDLAYGGAGLDILIANTGGDRLIDWVGEFNSYLVPFAPFGIATVSRQNEPQLPEFLYALSRSQGADPTRATDDGTDPLRNGEPQGELGLIRQQDHGLWQTQTGGPTDPQAGNIPGGKRDTLRGADFNNGSLQAFAVDSGVWLVTSGTLSVAAASLGQDAAAVFYVDEYIPIYFEITAAVTVQKPTGGWKANAYLIFDYYSPTDFKFAGIDVASNKIVLGHRTPQAWVVDAQAPFTGSLKSDTAYQVLVAVNGTAVTVSVEGKQAFSFAFAARVVSGQNVPLSKGFVGVGSDNSRGIFDNYIVQVLPPQVTLDANESFDDGVADQFTADRSGTWSVTGGRYSGTPSSSGIGLSTLDVGHGLQTSSYLELQATVRTSAVGGIVFDEYATNDAKFVALDVVGQKVLVGHTDPRRGYVVETSFAQALTAGVDYVVTLTMRGAAVSVSLNGVFVGTWSYNGAVVDGRFGTFTKGGTSLFDSFRVRTDDPAFTAPVTPSVSIADATVVEGAAPGTTTVNLTVSLSQAAATATTVAWATASGTATAGVDYVAASGTVTFAPGSTTAQISVTVLGDGLWESNESFLVNLSSAVGLTIARATGTITIVDDDPAPVVSVTATDAAGAEQASDPIRFTVTRSANLNGAIVVNLAWSGTATYGTDYTVSATGGTLSANGLQLTLASGVATATVTVTPVDDTAAEAAETIALTLDAGGGYTVGSPAIATGSIADNDTKTLSIGNAQVTEGDRNTANVTLTVTLSSPSPVTVTVKYTTVAGTATATSDFLATSGTLTFAAGATTATLTVAIVGDRTAEPTEMFTVVLSGAVNAVIANGTGTVTILDNDGALAPAAPTPAGAASIEPTTRVTASDSTSTLSAASLRAVAGATYPTLQSRIAPAYTAVGWIGAGVIFISRSWVAHALGTVVAPAALRFAARFPAKRLR